MPFFIKLFYEKNIISVCIGFLMSTKAPLYRCVCFGRCLGILVVKKENLTVFSTGLTGRSKNLDRPVTRPVFISGAYTAGAD